MPPAYQPAAQETTPPRVPLAWTASGCDLVRVPVAGRWGGVLLPALSGFRGAFPLPPLMPPECVCDPPADVPFDSPNPQGNGDAPPCPRHLHAAHAPAA